MLWSEIKRWAKNKGYHTDKHDNFYSWHMIDNSEVYGTTTSVSKLAKAIFNNITSNKFLEHQERYKNDTRL